MKRLYWLTAVILVLLLAAVPALSKDKKHHAITNPKIAFSECYSPWPGYKLTEEYSKLKTALEDEFGATVTSITGSWSQLTSDYDIFIIPGRFSEEPTDGECAHLRNWIENGGCCIILWYPGISKAQRWNGILNTHDKVIYVYGIYAARQPIGSNTFTYFEDPFGSDPYPISSVVGDDFTAQLGTDQPQARIIARSGSLAVTAYRENIGTGKGQLYVIANLFIVQNAWIDQYDNKDFLYNIIHYYTKGGGGGGGGTQPDLWAKLVKFTGGNLHSPGDQITLIARIKNKGKADAPATDVTFYLSPDKELDASDIEIDAALVPALAKNKSKKIKKVFLLPLTLAAGDYYIVAVVDEAEAVTDADRTNNVKASNKTVEIQ
jgi:hypothetical protein